MTEDEARETRCCGPDHCGETHSPDMRRYCVASKCMAWRWETVTKAGFVPHDIETDEGYCGLGGHP